MSKVLITGSTGFVGSHMVDYILKNQPEVELIVCAKRRRSDEHNVKHLLNHKKVKFIDVNLEDSKSVDNIFIVHEKFDKCFHLAAQSFVKLSFDSPSETLTTNIIGTLNVLESFRKFNPECVIQIAGSSEEYGEQLKTPIKEDAPLNPLSPYAVSKVTQEKLAYQYFKSYKLKTVITRTFNHEGPRRGEMFVTSAFAKQIAEIEKGLREPVISHGNLDSYRDYTDVRDVVGAYWLATEKCEYGEAYNICSGNSIKIEDMLKFMISKSTRSDIKDILDPAKLRPSDLIKLEGDNTKFCTRTGWSPTITTNDMFLDILNYWRERVSNG
jgi:GDP-4-dehydro-6-deoxy-D-mannose reductase